MEDRDDYPIIPQPENKHKESMITNLGQVLVTLDQKSIDSITEATIISINGEDFIRKKVASELVSKFADEKIAPMEKELASLKEVVKDLIPLAQEVFDSITIDDAESHREYISLKSLLDRAKRISDNK